MDRRDSATSCAGDDIDDVLRTLSTLVEQNRHETGDTSGN